MFAFFRRQAEPSSGTVPHPLHGFGALLRNPAFLRLGAAFGLVGVANWLVYTWLPAFLVETTLLGLAAAGFSATFYLQVASYAGILLGGFASDRWQQISPRGRILTQVIGLGVAAPFLFLMGTTRSFPVLVLGLILFGLGRGLTTATPCPCSVSSSIPACAPRATA
ncbi:MAG: MFS transporter [Paludibaculum sp.]